MSFVRVSRFVKSVPFRLALWYASVFTFSSLVVFVVLYWTLASAVGRQTDEALLDKAREFCALLSASGANALRDEIAREARATGTDEVFYRLLSRDGRTIAASDTAHWPDAASRRPALNAVRAGRPVLQSVRLASRRARVAYVRTGQDSILQLGKSLKTDERLLGDFRDGFAIAMAAAVALGCVGGWFMAARALRGVGQVTDAAREISAGMLDRRVPVRGTDDEIDRMATTFNVMLDRIQALVAGMREVTDDVAHDLRSPITRIRGSAEVALTQTRSPEELQAVLADTVEECDRLLATLNTMLEISEAEAGALKLDLEPVDVGALVREVAELFEPASSDKGVALECRASSSASVVQGDRQRLGRVVANLLDNAIKYTPPGGRIVASVEDAPGAIVLRVADSGVGIPQKELPRVFERFYRADPSRSQSGAGLGLSLVQAVARAHGGDVGIDSAPDRGTTIRVSLPA